MKIIAQKISYIFHPVFMPFIGLVIVFNANTYLSRTAFTSKAFALSTVGIFTILLPLANTLFLRKKWIIEGLQMNSASERRLPYIVAIICYMLAYFFLKKLSLSPVICLLMLGAIFSLVIGFTVNFSLMVSMHMIGMGGITGVMVGLSYRFMQDMQPILYALIFCSGLVGSARLYLNIHNPAHVYIGFFIGLLPVAVILSFF